MSTLALKWVAPILVLADTTALADTTYLAPDDFLREVFGTPPKPELIWLDSVAQARLQPIFGHPYRQARLRYWREGGRTAWILDDIGKEFPITAGFVIQGDHIERARVLVYRESRGMEIHFPGFLRQFAGSRLTGEALSQPIDGISGATLSVAAMLRMARAALVLNSLTP